MIIIVGYVWQTLGRGAFPIREQPRMKPMLNRFNRLSKISLDVEICLSFMYRSACRKLSVFFFQIMGIMWCLFLSSVSPTVASVKLRTFAIGSFKDGLSPWTPFTMDFFGFIFALFLLLFWADLVQMFERTTISVFVRFINVCFNGKSENASFLGKQNKASKMKNNSLGSNPIIWFLPILVWRLIQPIF